MVSNYVGIRLLWVLYPFPWLAHNNEWPVLTGWFGLSTLSHQHPGFCTSISCWFASRPGLWAPGYDALPVAPWPYVCLWLCTVSWGRLVGIAYLGKSYIYAMCISSFNYKAGAQKHTHTHTLPLDTFASSCTHSVIKSPTYNHRYMICNRSPNTLACTGVSYTSSCQTFSTSATRRTVK